MPGPKGEVCVACYFHGVLASGVLGECHHHSPMMPNGSDPSHWPTIHPISGWCGDYKVKPSGGE
jgi:hypothetical protein